MPEYVVLLSVPGLREQDLDRMPCLKQLTSEGDQATLVPSFPAVTCPVQANMTTGLTPVEHGVVANGFYWRERYEVEMWTSTNECIQRPQLWDIMHQHDSSLTAAVWFPLHCKGCGADFVCMPAPIHNADGTESMWCYSRPEGLYQQLMGELGQFPLQHFWGPKANIKSTAWITTSAVQAARQFLPNLFYIYLPHLDYAAQKMGPDSEAALQAVVDLDVEIGKLADGFAEAYGDNSPLWLVASEYVIVPVDHVSYPNRTLRAAGLLSVQQQNGRELLDLQQSRAWALVDHQFSHIFVRDSDQTTIQQAKEVLTRQTGVSQVLTQDELGPYELAHPLSGDLIVISQPNSWQAYYWWLDDDLAPAFARTIDIHRKPGFDPVELFWDPTTNGIPLDATLVKGSHGAPAINPNQRGVLLSSQRGVFVERPTADTDVADILLRQFGI